MLTDPAQITRANITNARTVHGIPHTHYQVPYKNIADLLRRQVDTYGDKPWLIFYGDDVRRTSEVRRTYTYHQFYQLVCKTANFLLSQDITRGDRIATIAFNHVDTVIQYFASWLIGAVIVPINVGEDDKRIGYILQNSQSKLAFVREEFIERVEKILSETPSVKTIVQVRNPLPLTGGEVHYPKIPGYIYELCRKYRKNQTQAEAILWECLRARRLNNLKFRRQHPLGRYIPDFYCAEENLVVEVEGKVHEFPDQKEYDKARREAIESLGLRVLRFKNEEVFNNLEGVLTLITSPPSPSPPVERGSRGEVDFHTQISTHNSQIQPSYEPNLDDEALIVYTSGTTGLPKGVVLTQYNLLIDAKAIAEWHKMTPDKRMMCVLPIHHVNGTVVTLMTPLYYGGSVVLNQKFHSNKFFERIANEKVHVVSVVPTLLQFLLAENPDMSKFDLSHFRHIICGAGPLTCELALKFEDRFHIPIVHGYGLSETTCYSCFLPLDLSSEEHRNWLKDYGFPSIGVPIPTNEMSIHDEKGNELKEGTKGEIVIRGHNVMKEYFVNPEANEKTFAFGWFRSGDEGFYKSDSKGRKFFFITGRIKELIIRGGANISPFEIDEVLMNLPGVKAGLAVGFENDWYGEEVGAYIQSKNGVSLTEQEVISYCRNFFPYSKCPKVVLFGDDVPVTSTGKYQRNKLEPLFEKWKSVQFTESKKGT